MEPNLRELCGKKTITGSPKYATTERSECQMAGDLTGKVIVLTGGGDGIGRECALAYSREEAVVAILDREMHAAQRTAAELGSTSMALHADVSDGEAVRAAIAAVMERF